MDYVPHTADDEKKMMEVAGIRSIDELFVDIPEKYRLHELLNLPHSLPEQDVFSLMKDLDSRNMIPPITLTGAGAYHCLLYTSDAADE